MKNKMKKIGVFALSLVAAFAFLSLSCTKVRVKGNAETVYAEGKIDEVHTAEALQRAFRSISQKMLPAVVEVDVVEKKVMSENPFESFRFFFFGEPDEEERGNKKDKKGKEYEASALGSGVIVKRDGKKVYVLTNNHVAGEATRISVKLNDEREFEGKLVGRDERMDIALISFESSNDESILVAPLADSDTVEVGDICLAFGAPLGLRQSVTQGIVSATGRSGQGIGNISDFIQTDAAINQGNSGGPLVNIYGEVIGINTWIASQSGGSQGLGFAIPINNLKSAIESFIKTGKLEYGWVGVSLMDVNDKYKKELGVEKNGALAAQVFLDSPAYKGGLCAGDYIVELNGKEVHDITSLIREVGGLKAGSVAAFTVIRGGKKEKISVNVEKRMENSGSDNRNLWPGFVAIPLTDEIRKNLNVEKSVSGVVVTGVLAKSPASSLRIQEQDIITAVNGKKISNIREFYEELSKAKDAVNFDVYAEGHTIETNKYKLK